MKSTLSMPDTNGFSVIVDFSDNPRLKDFPFFKLHSDGEFLQPVLPCIAQRLAKVPDTAKLIFRSYSRNGQELTCTVVLDVGEDFLMGMSDFLVIKASYDGSHNEFSEVCYTPTTRFSGMGNTDKMLLPVEQGYLDALIKARIGCLASVCHWIRAFDTFRAKTPALPDGDLDDLPLLETPLYDGVPSSMTFEQHNRVLIYKSSKTGRFVAMGTVRSQSYQEVPTEFWTDSAPTIMELSDRIGHDIRKNLTEILEAEQALRNKEKAKGYATV